MTRLIGIAAMLFATGVGAEEPATPITIGYRCDDGKRLMVEYARDRAGRITVTQGTKRWKMQRSVSATGERSVDENESMEWWTKGRSGTLPELGARKGVGCREQTPPKAK